MKLPLLFVLSTMKPLGLALFAAHSIRSRFIDTAYILSTPLAQQNSSFGTSFSRTSISLSASLSSATNMADNSSAEPTAASNKCIPCSALNSSALMSVEEVQEYVATSLPLWTVKPISEEIPTTTGNSQPQKLSRSFTAKNFQAALDAINAMGVIAETENHHPDFHLTNYREVQIDMFTHKLNGITRNDLVMAEKLDQVSILYSPKWLKAHPQAEASSKVS